jgi:hypothetical protein
MQDLIERPPIQKSREGIGTGQLFVEFHFNPKSVNHNGKDHEIDRQSYYIQPSDRGMDHDKLVAIIDGDRRESGDAGDLPPLFGPV